MTLVKTEMEKKMGEVIWKEMLMFSDGALASKNSI
jgi:hypothetical protein